MSPSYFTLHPVAVFFADCGLGSDPDYTGPCTGTSGTSSPDYLSASLNSSLAQGKGQLMAIGAALLVLAALLLLVRMIRKPTGVRTSRAESADLDGYVCRKCGSDDIAGSSVDLVTCGACGFAGNADDVRDSPAEDPAMSDADFVAKLESLEPGQAWCMDCDVTYWTDEDDSSCPCCGNGRRDDEDWSCEAEAAESVQSDGTGRGFTTCAACGFADDPENIEDNGGVCNACYAEHVVEAGHTSTRSIGGGEGFR